jgi:hypothetical protein
LYITIIYKKGDNEDQNVGIGIASRAMTEPLRQIVVNAGEEGSVVLNKVRDGKGNYGFNAQTGEYTDIGPGARFQPRPPAGGFHCLPHRHRPARRAQGLDPVQRAASGRDIEPPAAGQEGRLFTARRQRLRGLAAPAKRAWRFARSARSLARVPTSA